MTGPDQMPARPRYTRFGWSLAAWLVLSLAACLAVLAMHRPAAHQRPAQREPERPVAARPAIPRPSTPVRSPSSVTSSRRTAAGSTGWRLQLFYSPALSYHRGGPVRVTGCADVSCRRSGLDLGRYPREFLAAVRTQGSGYLDGGPHRGRYLGWDAVRGYWLDTAPRGPGAVPLQRFVSVISSTPQLSTGTALRVSSCGAGSRAGWAAVCAVLRASSWRVAAVDLSTKRTARLYVGVENQPHFAAGPWVEAFRSAVLRVG